MKKAMTAAVLLIMMCWFPLWARGEENLSFDLNAQQQEVAPGENLSFLLSLDGNSRKKVSTFRIRVTFDPSQLEFRGLQEEGETGVKDYRYHEKENEVIIIFLSESGGIVLDGAKKELLSLRFLVKKQGTDGEAGVQAVVDGVGADDLQELNPEENLTATAQVVTPDYSLAALKPDTGRLTPEFRPDILNYKVEVGYLVDQITFYASPVNEEAVVKVSRKSLEKAGTSTKIQITVRSPNGTIQKTYEVTVVRQQKPVNSEPASGGRTSGSSWRTSSTKTKSSPGWEREEEEDSGESHEQSQNGIQRQATRSNLTQRENNLGPFLLGGAIFLVAAFAIVLIQQRVGKGNHSRNKEKKQEEKTEKK